MMDQNRPSKMPAAWPTDGQSTIRMMLGVGWVLTHRDRTPMLWQDGKWIDYINTEEKAA